MNSHPISRLIYESLIPSPSGFQLDPKQAPKILEALSRSNRRADQSGEQAFYATVGLLQQANGQPAAKALLSLTTHLS